MKNWRPFHWGPRGQAGSKLTFLELVHPYAVGINSRACTGNRKTEPKIQNPNRTETENLQFWKNRTEPKTEIQKTQVTVLRKWVPNYFKNRIFRLIWAKIVLDYFTLPNLSIFEQYLGKWVIFLGLIIVETEPNWKNEPKIWKTNRTEHSGFCKNRTEPTTEIQKPNRTENRKFPNRARSNKVLKIFLTLLSKRWHRNLHPCEFTQFLPYKISRSYTE